MDFYLLTIYVSLEQELAIRELFVCKGWHFSKKEDSEADIGWKYGKCSKTWTACKKLVPEITDHSTAGNDQELDVSEDEPDETAPHPEIFSDLQDFVEATLNAANVTDELPGDHKDVVKVCDSNLEPNNSDGKTIQLSDDSTSDVDDAHDSHRESNNNDGTHLSDDNVNNVKDGSDIETSNSDGIHCSDDSEIGEADEAKGSDDELIDGVSKLEDHTDVGINVAESVISGKTSNESTGNQTGIDSDKLKANLNNKIGEPLSENNLEDSDILVGTNKRHLRSRTIAKSFSESFEVNINEKTESINVLQPSRQGNKELSKYSSFNSSNTLVANSRKHVTKLKRKAIKRGSNLLRDQSKLAVVKVSKVGTFYCVDCKNTYHLLGAYKNHKRDGKCSFECEYCGKSFTSRYYSNYKCHVKNHAKDRNNECSICKKSYSDMHTLNIHMRKHSGVRPYMCQHCGRQFYSSSHLLSHEANMHSEPPEKYQCDICNAKLSTLGNLRVHQNVVHAKERPFTCEICGKSFKTKKTLEQVHAKVHLNVHPFVCDYSGCGKKFKRSGSYTEHVRRHNNQRSHFCKNCGKGFYTKKDMLLHTRIHTGERPYQCKMCEYKCALLGNLQKHLKTHVT